ncbi:dihydrofolate reductase family protein [Gorillibacterium sp. CAU 1737]|uniref:dihydrofolate reductase family protein n=1 Tax=Gorillibacterium sp. CAU 1737 TaxID=3140362 RepID=UPI0032603BD4
MSGKIILNLAVSLDGYIASEDGSYEWIVGHGDSSLDTEKQLVFEQFVDSVDVVVMGKRCYEQGMHKEYAHKKVYVATSEALESKGNLTFIQGDIVRLIQEEKQQGRTIYLFGGGVVIDAFVKANAIDEYIIGFIPIVLGQGRPLFLGGNPTIPLRTEEVFVQDGIVIMRYTKR